MPARGDVVRLDRDPAVGHEMKVPHDGLVLSRDASNIGTGVIVVLPVTSMACKLSAFEFPAQTERVNGVAILSLFRPRNYQATACSTKAPSHPNRSTKRLGG
jgi:mRNA interferase MazF/mRNA interferase ChpB